MSLQYKGINLSGLEFGSGNRPYYDYISPGAEHYNYWAQDVGANVVRVPFSWERLQTEAGGALDGQYVNFLKEAVANAASNGMTVILDMHNYASYQGERLSDSAALSDVWIKLGKEFEGNPSVWLNLMNEPNNISAQSWAQISQDVVNDLRGEGIDNKILLSGTEWSGAHSWIKSGNAEAYAGFVDPLNNYAFDVHQYLDMYSTGTHGHADEGIGSTSLVAITQWAEESGHQLFLGEIGAANPDINGQQHALTELNDLFEYMEQHSDAWLGWTLWGAGPWWPDNYHFNINPADINAENPVDNAIIQNIIDWFSIVSDAEEIEDISLPAPIFAEHLFSQSHDVFGNNSGSLKTTSALGAAHGDFNLSHNSIITITSQKADAGYYNTLGAYAIGADGTINAVSIAFDNVRQQKSGTQTSLYLEGGPDMQFGMFIIANGFKDNKGFAGINLSNLQFVYNFGQDDERAARVTDDGKYVSLVSRDGDASIALKGFVYHSEYKGEISSLNKDGTSHMQTGLTHADDQTSLRIGFEDYKNGGDQDFNDVIFDIKIHHAGTDGNDILYGSDGDDLLYGGLGADLIMGGDGKNTYLYKSVSEGGDTIADFKTGNSGDVLDIKGLLESYDPLHDDIDNFIRVTQGENGLTLSIDSSGTATNYIPIALLQDVHDVSAQSMIQSGSLITN